MRDGIRPVLQRLAKRRVVIPPMLAALLCLAAFQWRDARLDGLELLDVRQWYTPEQAAALFGALDRLDPRARAVYTWTEVSVDLIFPVAYGLLLALALLRLFGDARPFYVLPIAGAVGTSSRTSQSRCWPRPTMAPRRPGQEWPRPSRC